MKFADSNASGNPSSQDPQAVARKALEAIDGITSQLKQVIRDAAEDGDSFDSVERKVRKATLEIGHQAMELFIRLQGDGGESASGSQQLAAGAPVTRTRPLRPRQPAPRLREWFR